MKNSNGKDLISTGYCDFNHTEIRKRADLIAKDAEDVNRVASLSFTWVRDRIPFGFDLVRVKASETLRKGYGACFNKSLLLVALLRANGIPARFCSAPVNRWFIKPYIGLQCLLINHPFHHCFVQIGLNDRWSFAEPALDRKTYDALFRPLGVKWGIEWDAANQDRLYLESLMGEPVVHEDIDRIIDMNVGNAILPAPLAKMLCKRINRKAWRRIGVSV